MKVYQLFYTSCKKGLSSGMGFQTYSMSEGITRDEMEEIESHCFYVPPENLPGSPTEDEIAKFFPVSFSFFKLKSGKKCICRTKYSGKDYSGRFGNYFCHVLIIGEDNLPFYPIELYESQVFRDGLIKEEEESEVIASLPVLYEIPKGSITLEKIEKFLKGDAAKKRTKTLSLFIDGIIDGKINEKKIFFCDEKSNLPLWIGAATMTLPISLASSITFNTYSFDAENNSEFICGSLRDGTRFDFNEAKGVYKCNLFNFQDCTNSEFSFRSKFAQQTSLEYTLIKDYREALIGFMKLFNYNKLDANVENCVNLLNLVNNGIERIGDEEVVRSIDFANKYASTAALEQIMIKLNDNTLNKIMTKLNLNLAEVIFKFLFRIARLTEKKEYTDKAYEFFFNSLNYMIGMSEEIEISSIIELHNSIRDYNIDSIVNFISRSIERERLENITSYLENGTLRHAVYYLCTIIGDFMRAGGNGKQAIPWRAFGNNGYFPTFTKKALSMLIESREDMKFVLSYVYSEKDYFTNCIIISYKIALDRKREITIISLLDEFLAESPVDEAIEIRKDIFENEAGSEILLNVYKYEISKSENKKEYFKKYCINIFDENSNYREKCFNAAAEELLSYCSNDDFKIEEFLWFFKYVKKRRLQKNFTYSLAFKIVEIFQKVTPIEIVDDSIWPLLIDIDDLEKQHYVNVKPNISQIVLAINELNNNPNKVPEFLNDEVLFQFDGIEKGKYEEILRLAFKIICPSLKEEIAHVHLKRIFQYDKYFEIFLKVYLETNTDIFNEMKGYRKDLSENMKSSYEIYLDAIYYLLKSSKTFSGEQKEAVKNSIIENLKSVDKAELNNYNSYMKIRISNTSIHKEEIRDQWDEIYDGILEQGKKKKWLFNKR